MTGTADPSETIGAPVVARYYLTHPHRWGEGKLHDPMCRHAKDGDYVDAEDLTGNEDRCRVCLPADSSEPFPQLFDPGPRGPRRTHPYPWTCDHDPAPHPAAGISALSAARISPDSGLWRHPESPSIPSNSRHRSTELGPNPAPNPALSST